MTSYADALAEAGRLREAHERIGIGGNHLASALIHILAAGEDTFPPYGTDITSALEIIGDPVKWDLWVCWKTIMEARDSVASTPTTAAWLEARDRRNRLIGAAEWLECNNERLDTMNRSDVQEVAAQLRKAADNA